MKLFLTKEVFSCLSPANNGIGPAYILYVPSRMLFIVCVCSKEKAQHMCRGQSTTLGSQFSPSSMWVSRIEFRSSDLVISVPTRQAISPSTSYILQIVFHFLIGFGRVTEDVRYRVPVCSTQGNPLRFPS